MLNGNAKILKEKYPEDYTYMIEMGEDNSVIDWVKARDGSAVPAVRTGGGIIRLNSTYHPLCEAAKWAEQFDYQNLKTNIFMFGMGNGMFAREILSRMKADAKLFIYEPDDEIMVQVFQKVDISGILSDERLFLILDKAGTERFEEAVREYIHWSTIPTQILCCHPGYDKIYPEKYQHYRLRLQRMIDQAEVAKNTNAWFSGVVSFNTIKNIAFIKESNYIDEVKAAIPAKGKAAIIVAAGPSLDKNIMELKKAQDRAFIIAVDSAVSRLETERIAYDCIVTTDPDKITGDLLEYDAWKDVPLFCDIVSKYDIMSSHRGKKIWYTASWLLESLYGKRGISFVGNVKGGGSVATVAFAIAEFLGFEVIILAGQDLAYQGDATHAGGQRRYYIKNEEASVMYVDGVNGRQVKSRWDWVYYRDWFEEKISVNKDITVVDATEGGALIHGSEVCRLTDAIDRYCGEEFAFRETLEKMPPTFDTEQYAALRGDILHIQEELENVRNKAQEGLGFCRDYLKSIRNMKQKKHDRLVRGIKKTNKYIERQEMACMMLELHTSKLAVDDIADVNRVTGNAKYDEINTVKMAQKIYSAYSEGAEEILSIMKTESNIADYTPQ